MRPVVQSYKKVMVFAEASFTAGFQTELLVQGADSVAAGQTSATDAIVPTGSILKYIEIQFCARNAAAAALYLNCTIQYKLAGQVFLDPDSIGGSAQRNQVMHMDLFSIGTDQNSTHKFRFKVPKGFQRIRENTQWGLVWNSSGSVNRKAQAIYKFYR